MRVLAQFAFAEYSRSAPLWHVTCKAADNYRDADNTQVSYRGEKPYWAETVPVPFVRQTETVDRVTEIVPTVCDACEGGER